MKTEHNTGVGILILLGGNNKYTQFTIYNI